MLLVVLSFLTAGALTGIYLAQRHFRHLDLPMPIALIHGLAGATALVVLLFFVVARPGFGKPGIALAILLGTAILGFINFSLFLRGRRINSGILIVHALAALTGFGTLIYVVLNS